MNRAVVVSILALAFLGAASSAGAHHPPRFERCKSLTFSGQLERVNWRNPHVELSIKADDGTTYQVLWLNVQQLGRAGIRQDTLNVGDQLVITAGTRDDGEQAPVLLSEIRRPSDGWQWSKPAEGC